MGVRWSVASPCSSRHVEERLEERGVPIDHATIQRWVVPYRLLLEKALHRRQRPVSIAPWIRPASAWISCGQTSTMSKPPSGF